MIKQIAISTLLVGSCIASCSSFAIEAMYTEVPPVIDGLDNEAQWSKADWLPIADVIVGGEISKDDFSGQYRLLWDENYLYLQARIQDDVLFDQHIDPVDRYWDDDALEVFIDEDGSGGDHLYSHNAFAYHISLDNQVADLAPNEKPALFNQHVNSSWQRSSEEPFFIIWELAIAIYPDTFKHQGDGIAPVKLTDGKVLGFMLAYCDNDGSPSREHFIGSKDIEAVNGDKNRGYLDASVFDKLTLKK